MDIADTKAAAYAERLNALETSGWKRLLDVQAPYRWNLQRLNLGRTLDVGCGIGRNLKALGPDSVGIDHNDRCVALAKERGLKAFTPNEFRAAPESFDSLLFAHVLEHLLDKDANELIGRYLRYLKPGGRVVLITPQEAGYKTDETHIRFVDFSDLRSHSTAACLLHQRSFSFPFPRPVGKIFPYNEFVVIATLGASLTSNANS
jgi:2-polyprenyl-3-methyl-5-hydroxy-6-metoxy-1,4-benzoquinol methylase